MKKEQLRTSAQKALDSIMSELIAKIQDMVDLYKIKVEKSMSGLLSELEPLCETNLAQTETAKSENISEPEQIQ